MLNKHSLKTLPKTCRNRITGRLPCNVGRAIRRPFMSGFADAHSFCILNCRLLPNSCYLTHICSPKNLCMQLRYPCILYAGRGAASASDLYVF